MNDLTETRLAVEPSTELIPLPAEPPRESVPLSGHSDPNSPVRPFGLLLKKNPAPKGAYFEPAAAILITSALRTSGLLRAMPAEELKTLLWLFTYITPNGDLLPTTAQLAEAMGVSEGKATSRLQKLHETTWQNEPIVCLMERDNGLHAWIPTPSLFAVEQEQPQEEQGARLPYQPAGREAVITHSRETYARPRAEVEAMIAKQMGWEEPGEPATAEEAVLQDTRQRLHLLGLSKEEVGTLVERFPIERIQRQLYYLPYRHAKSPARFLMAAIESDYEPPLALRHKLMEGQATETSSVEGS